MVQIMLKTLCVRGEFRSVSICSLAWLAEGFILCLVWLLVQTRVMGGLPWFHGCARARFWYALVFGVVWKWHLGWRPTRS